jgi:UDP-GlcNAc:undecaprenyl-phosphate GlcNAc-1-phosphate transferase
MFASLASTLPLSGWPTLDVSILMGRLALLIVCGIADDLVHLPPVSKLVVQLVAAAMMLTPMVFAAPTCPLGAWTCFVASPLALVFVAGMINVVNMLDGVDGLAGGSAVIAFLWLAAATVGDASEVLPVSLLFAAVTAGFLVFNLRHPWRRRATIFMGDAGSVMLGAALAWCGVKLARIGSGTVQPAAVLWVLALPIIDGTTVAVRRLRQGLDPMRADRRHLHHLLQATALSVALSVGLLLLVSALLGAVGVLGWRLGLTQGELTAGLSLPIPLYVLMVAGLTRRGPQRFSARPQVVPAPPVGSATR